MEQRGGWYSGNPTSRRAHIFAKIMQTSLVRARQELKKQLRENQTRQSALDSKIKERDRKVSASAQKQAFICKRTYTYTYTLAHAHTHTHIRIHINTYTISHNHTTIPRRSLSHA